MPNFQPSAVAVLTILFDEGKTPGQPTSQLDPDSNTVAATPQATEASVGHATSGPKVRTVSKASQPATAKGVVKTFYVQPLSCSYTRNSYKTADTAKAKFNYLSLPIPADAVRGADIRLCMDNVEASATGGASVNQPGFLAPDGSAPPWLLRPSLANTRFLGMVDEWDEDISEGTIEVTARDYTGILQNRHVNPKTLSGIDWTKPLDLAIVDLIDTVKSMANRIRVAPQLQRGVFYPQGVLPPAGSLFAKAHKPSKRQHQSHATQTYWEVIEEACLATGFIPYVYLDTLVITTARNIYSSIAAAPVMVYGQNLKTLKFKRRMGGLKDSPVFVFAYCPDAKPPRTLIGAYPPPSPPPSIPPTTVPSAALDPIDPQAAQQHIVRLEMPPIGLGGAQGLSDISRAQAYLNAQAENAWHLLAKNTLSGSFTTDDTWSYARQRSPVDSQSSQQSFDNVGGAPATSPGATTPVGPGNPDLYNLQTGDPVKIAIRGLNADEPDGPPAMLFNGMTEDQIAHYLVNRLNFQDPTVALQIGRMIKRGDRNRIFRVKTAKIEFDSEKGAEVCVDFTELVIAHSDPSNKTIPSGLTPVPQHTNPGAARRGN